VKGKRKGKKQYTPALTGTKHKTKIQKKGRKNKLPSQLHGRCWPINTSNQESNKTSTIKSSRETQSDSIQTTHWQPNTSPLSLKTINRIPLLGSHLNFFHHLIPRFQTCTAWWNTCTTHTKNNNMPWKGIFRFAPPKLGRSAAHYHLKPPFNEYHILSSLWRTDTTLSLRCDKRISHSLFSVANGYHFKILWVLNS
jgi:hypothetical protein